LSAWLFNIDAEFELEKGWALKSKQKYGIRGGGNPIENLCTEITYILYFFTPIK